MAKEILPCESAESAHAAALAGFFLVGTQTLVPVRQNLHESVPGIRQVQQVLNCSLRANFVAAELPKHLLLVVIRLNAPANLVELERVKRHEHGAGVTEGLALLPGMLMCREYGIRLTEDETKELSKMCNLSEGVYDNGVSDGISQGISLERGASLRNLMKNTGWPLEKAMPMLNIPSEEEARYKKIMKKEH